MSDWRSVPLRDEFGERIVFKTTAQFVRGNAELFGGGDDQRGDGHADGPHLPVGGNGIEGDAGERGFHIGGGVDGDAAGAAIVLAAADEDVQFALAAVEAFMDQAVEFGGCGGLEFLRDFPTGFEETFGMAAADERSGTGEMFPVFQIRDVLAPVDRLDGDVLVGLADEVFARRTRP